MSWIPGQTLYAQQLTDAFGQKVDAGVVSSFGFGWLALSDGAAALTKLGLPTAGVGLANGLLVLGSDGKVPTSLLPASGESYKGVWNAATNSPTLTSGSGTSGDYYLVSTAGTTTLDGISSWAVGDKVSFSSGAWHKIPGISSAVTSVAGATGAVTATQILDAIGSTQGYLLYRSASGWTYLAPGSAGQVLISGGAGANPSWATFPTTWPWSAISGKPTTLAGYGIGIAAQSDATTGTDNILAMTPLRVAQAIAALVGKGWVPIASTTISSPVAYVEHIVDFSSYTMAVTFAFNISGDAGGYHRYGVFDSSGTNIEYQQSGLSIANTKYTDGYFYWCKNGGILSPGSPSAAKDLSTADRMRVYLSGSGNLDSGFVVTFGVK